jgi:hypothetical protein
MKCDEVRRDTQVEGDICSVNSSLSPRNGGFSMIRTGIPKGAQALDVWINTPPPLFFPSLPQNISKTNEISKICGFPTNHPISHSILSISNN